MSHGEIRKNWVKEGFIASACGMLYGNLIYIIVNKYILIHYVCRCYKCGCRSCKYLVKKFYDLIN